jgi:hypothetical protein
VNNDYQDIRRMLDLAAGHAVVSDAFLHALMAQIPDKRRLMTEFSKLTDQAKTCRASSTETSAFVEALEKARNLWAARIQEAQDEDRKRAR